MADNTGRFELEFEFGLQDSCLFQLAKHFAALIASFGETCSEQDSGTPLTNSQKMSHIIGDPSIP